MAFVERLIRLTISINPAAKQKTFSGTDSNTITLSGLRCLVSVKKAGGPSDCTAEITVFGMTKSMMMQLSTLGMQINLIPTNKIVVEAGDADSGWSTVFVGAILGAYADFNSSPEVPFQITAHAGLPEAVIPATVSSFQGSADVATIMQSLATKMGLSFENSGVTGKINNTYLSGSLKSQVLECARQANISHVIDLGKLAIWPKNGTRKGQVPTLSKSTGMKGYPTFTAYGITLESVYNPSIPFGGMIEVVSELEPACGRWSVYGLNHELQSNVPGGKWFSQILAYNPKYPAPVLHNG